MSEVSEPEFEMTPGQRLTVRGASEAKLAQRHSLIKSRKDTDLKLLQLEHQNQMLFDKLNNYQRFLAKESEMASKEVAKDALEADADHTLQSQPGTTMADRMAVLSEAIESKGKVELLERIATLRIRNEEMRQDNCQWELKCLKLKQKYLQLKDSKALVAELLGTSKKMAVAVHEFKGTKTIGNALVDTIDLEEFNELVRRFENELRLEQAKKPRDQLRILNQVKVDRKDLEVKDKTIKSLQEQLGVLQVRLAMSAGTGSADDFEVHKLIDREQNAMRLKIEEANQALVEQTEKLRKEAERARVGLEKKVREAEERLEGAERESDRLRGQLKEAEMAKGALDKAVAEWKAVAEEKTSGVARMREELKAVVSKVGRRVAKEANLSSSLIQSALQKDHNETADLKEALLQSKAKLEEMSQVVSRLTEMRNDPERETLVSRVEQLEAELMREKDKASQFELRQSVADQQVQDLQQRLNKLTETLQRERQTVDRLEGEAEQLRDAVGKANRPVDTDDAETAAARAKMKVYESQIEEMRIRLDQREGELEEMREQNRKAMAELFNSLTKGTAEEVVAKKLDRLQQEYQLINFNFDLLTNNLEETRTQLAKSRSAELANEQRRTKLFEALDESKKKIALLERQLKGRTPTADNRMGSSKVPGDLSVAWDQSGLGNGPSEYQLFDLRNKADQLKLQLELQVADNGLLKQQLTALGNKAEAYRLEAVGLAEELSQLGKAKELYEHSAESLRYLEDLKAQKQQLIQAKADAETQLTEAQGALQKLLVEFNDFKMDASARDTNAALAEAESAVRALQAKLAESDSRLLHFQTLSLGLQSERDSFQKRLEVELREKQKFEARLTETERFILDGRVQRFKLDHDSVNPQLTIQRLKEAHDTLTLKLGAVTSRNNELEGQCADLESRLNDLSKKSGDRKQLEGELEMKNTQIYEMLANANSKQVEIDTLRVKFNVLQTRLKESVGKDGKTDSGNDSDYLDQVLEEHRLHFRLDTVTPFKGIKEELAAVYNKLDQVERDMGIAVGFGEARQVGRATQGREVRAVTDMEALRARADELTVQVEQLTVQVEVAKKREEEFKGIEGGWEDKVRRADQQVEDLQRAMHAKTFRCQELETARVQNEAKLNRMRKEADSAYAQLIDKEKELIVARVSVNRLEVEFGSRAVLLKMAEAQIKDLGVQREALVKQREQLELEMGEVSEQSYAAFHNLLSAHNEEQQKHNITKSELAIALKHRAKAERVAAEAQSALAAQTDEMARLRVQGQHLSDRVELLLRVSKLTGEEFKTVVKLGEVQLDRDLRVHEVADLTKKVGRLTEALAGSQGGLEEAKRSQERSEAELRSLRKHVADVERELDSARKRLIEKNNTVTRLQSDILTVRLDHERDNNGQVLLKIQNADLESRLSFVMKQVELFGHKVRARLSLVDSSSQTDEHELAELEGRPGGQSVPFDAVRLMREFRLKMKVKNDHIQNLTENLDLLQRRLSEEEVKHRRLGLLDLREDDLKREEERLAEEEVLRKRAGEFGQKVLELEKALRGKEGFEHELMELIEQKRASDGFKNQLCELLKAESEGHRRKADQLSRDLFKSQEMVSQYLLEVHRLRDQVKELETGVAEKESARARLERDNRELSREGDQLRARVDRLCLEAEVGQRVEADERQRAKEEADSLKSRLASLEKLVQDELRGAELSREYEAYKESEVSTLNSKNQRLVDRFSDIKQVKVDNESLRKDSWVVKSRLDTAVKEVEFLKSKLGDAQRELGVAKQNLSDQEHMASLLTVELDRVKSEHSNELKLLGENHKEDMEALGQVVHNQREILKRNYKAYASRVNGCNQEIRQLRAKLYPGQPVDYEEELKTSILLEELFEKDHEMVRVGSSRKLEDGLDLGGGAHQVGQAQHQGSLNEEGTVKAQGEVQDQRPKHSSKALKALEEAMRTESIKEEDNEDAGSNDSFGESEEHDSRKQEVAKVEVAVQKMKSKGQLDFKKKDKVNLDK
jgi:hypothetical protein